MRFQLSLALVLPSMVGCGSRPAQPVPASPIAIPGCYQFEFAPWHSSRPGFHLDTMPRTFRLTNDPIARTPVSGTLQFRARQVSGPTFGGYAPQVEPVWNRIAGDSGGFSLTIHDMFSGIYLQVAGADPELRGSATLDSDELVPDSAGVFSAVVAEAKILATRVDCP